MTRRGGDDASVATQRSKTRRTGRIPAGADRDRPRQGPAPRGPAAGGALVRLAAAETIGAAYEAWAEALVARAAAAAERARERDRIDRNAEILIGTIEKAREVRPPRTAAPRGRALARRGAFEAVQARARAEQARLRQSLVDREARDEAHFGRALAQARGEVNRRVRAHLRAGALGLEVSVRPVGTDRVLVHLQRPSHDEAVMLCLLLTGRAPTRHGFFADDAVDDVRFGPARFYAEEGIAAARLDAVDDEDAVLDRAGEYLPVRGIIPVRLPDRPFPRFRLVHHGPLSEVESRREGQPYANVLPRADAEQFTGYLLSLKLEGALRLNLRVE